MSTTSRSKPGSSENLRPFPLPREHGAWALLYGPFVFMVLAFAQLGLNILLLFFTLTFFFLAHEPLSRLARMNLETADPLRKSYWWRWLGIYAAGGAVSGASLMWTRELFWLVPMGAAILVLLSVHVLLIASRREKLVVGELLGVVGLTASVPVSYYVIHQNLNQQALVLWLLNVLYFSSAIFYVKMVVSRHVASRQQEAARRTRHCVLYHLALVAIVGALIWAGRVPSWTFAAFVPITARAFAGTTSGQGRLNLKRIGYTEVAHTVVFICLMVAVWQWAE